MSSIRSLLRIATMLLPVVVASTADAQVRRRRPPEERNEESYGPPTTWVGGSITYAQPRGEFQNYVDGAIGLNGHVVHQFGDGIVAFRAEVGYLIYGSTTHRQPLGGGALGLVNVDVTTSNNIFNGGMGLQLMAPRGIMRPYITGGLGFSYFFTESSVAGSNENSPFADTENYGDGGFTTNWGGGFYIPIKSNGKNPVSLDIGIQSHANSDMRYLTKESIEIKDTATQPTIRPVRSAANFVSFRLGVTVGVR